MLRSVVISRLAAESGVIDAATLQPLVAAYQQSRSALTFERWALQTRKIAPDIAVKLSALFTSSMFECMGCSNLIAGADLVGDVDALCPRCGNAAMKLRVPGRPDASVSQARASDTTPMNTPVAGPGGTTRSVPRSDRMQRSGATETRTRPPGPADPNRTGRVQSDVANPRGPSTPGEPTPRSPMPGTTRIAGAGGTTAPPSGVTGTGARTPSAISGVHKPGTGKLEPGPTPMEGPAGKDPPKIGNWQLLGLIGSGGSGRVFKAYHPVLDRYAAIKVLTACHEKLRHRFYYEARILARLIHPAIVQILDFGEHESIPYFVMEWVEGPSLRQLVTRLGPRPVIESVNICIEICGGMALAHDNGVIHRDIKPANILVGTEGVKITDFGLAVSDDMSVRLTQPGTVLGTPAYMAPEQVTGEEVSPATDIYGLGATLFNMVTGRQPFMGEQQTQVMAARLNGRFPLARELNPDLPPELDELLQWMCSRRPKDRPQDIRVVAGTLDEVLKAIDRRSESRKMRANNNTRQAIARPGTPGDASSSHSFPPPPPPAGSRGSASSSTGFVGPPSLPPLPPDAAGATSSGGFRAPAPPPAAAPPPPAAPPPAPAPRTQTPPQPMRSGNPSASSSTGFLMPPSASASTTGPFKTPSQPPMAGGAGGAGGTTRLSVNASDTGDVSGVSQPTQVNVDLVQVAGNIGNAEWQRLNDQITASDHAGIPVVLDLSHCAGVSAAVVKEMRKNISALGERVILAEVPGPVKIALEQVGLPGQLRIEATVESAIELAGGGRIRTTRYRSF
ncbi:MAG: protein kinase [Planctomycetota bacterium]